MSRTVLFFAMLLLAGCPSFEAAGAYRCDGDADCPGGRRCLVEQHLCAPAGTSNEAPDAGPTDTPDAGSAPDEGPTTCDGKPHTLVFMAGPALDLLWIVDNSGSMQPHQSALADHASAMLEALRLHGVDFQLGVTSTDVDDRGAFYPLQGDAVRIVSPFTPEAAQVFARNATTGTAGSGDEKGLATARLALTSPEIDGANKGFLREESTLVVAFVSDEDDDSPSAVSEYVTFFHGLHPGKPEQVKAVAFTGPAPNGCDFSGSPVVAGTRYLQVVSAVGGASESICAPDWAKPLTKVADDAPVRRQFRLGFPETVSVQSVVRVSSTGARSPVAGWQLEQATKTVTLQAGTAPARGERLEIGYTRTCE